MPKRARLHIPAAIGPTPWCKIRGRTAFDGSAALKPTPRSKPLRSALPIWGMRINFVPQLTESLEVRFPAERNLTIERARDAQVPFRVSACHSSSNSTALERPQTSISSRTHAPRRTLRSESPRSSSPGDKRSCDRVGAAIGSNRAATSKVGAGVGSNNWNSVEMTLGN